MSGGRRPGTALAIVMSVAIRPALWPSGLRALRRMAPPGWWRRRPFLPLPADDYLAFRLQTQYGGDGTNAPAPRDVLEYLRWLRRWS